MSNSGDPMLNTTLPHLRCPISPCGSSRLALHVDRKQTGQGKVFDVLSGNLECSDCGARFPILAGVAILVADVEGFLFAHIKGIASVVAEAEFPREYARELKAAKAQLQAGHIEDDLEAERVISLYLMNHYLQAKGAKPEWWKPLAGAGSPLIDRLVREHWDQGPLAQIEKKLRSFKLAAASVVELGCGIGGLSLKLGAQNYLGVDSSFASIALARHLAIGAPYRGKIRIPEDLLQGPVSREVQLETHARRDGSVDFVVGELEAAPVAQERWDVSIALNTIDMLEDPSILPRIQKGLLKKSGVAIQSCPYIWHESVAQKLRTRLPRNVRSSAGAVEWLYEKAGLGVDWRQDQVPWLFFKHVRQLEIYSVHLFSARVADSGSR